ncbi:ABC transporter permease [Sphingobacterium alkalisoli]|nr:ABC transporter permease [Sphingobacterium alkalisoli]
MTIGALALAVIAIILSVAILRGFKDEVTAKQRGFFSDVIISKNDLNDSYENSPISLSSGDLDRILRLSNVVDVVPFATKAGVMNVDGEVEGVLLKGVDKNYDQSFLARTLVAGDTLNFVDRDSDTEILISKLLSDRLNLKVGDDFIMYFVQKPIRKRKMFVKGVFQTNSAELDKMYVIGSLDLIRRLNNLGEADAGAYEVRVENFDDIQQTTAAVDEELPVTLKATNIIEQFPDVFNWLKMLDMNDDIIFVLMVIVAVINMISALLISILERTSMIGILKSLGMANRQIRKIFLYNSIYLIGCGLVLGNIITIGLYFFQTNTRFFKLDPSIYYIEYVPMSITWYDVVLLNLAIVFIALVTLYIPSMLISRISPIKTIQFK